MLKDMDALEKGFQATAKKSDQKCKVELAELHKFIFDTRCVVNNNVESVKTGIIDKKKWVNSLFSWCFYRSTEESGHILFLARHGLYRNAFDTIRHMLESTIQALYLDSRYRGLDNIFLSRPEPNIFVKITILSEVEDKREYHALRLIGELDIGHKDRIKRIYKELSQMIHPSHKQIEKTMEDFVKHSGEESAVSVDCKEITNIYRSLVNFYDVFWYLYLTFFPEIQDSLAKTESFNNFVKNYGLYLVPKILKDYSNQKKQ